MTNLVPDFMIDQIAQGDLKIPKMIAKLMMNYGDPMDLIALFEKWDIDPTRIQYLGEGSYAKAYWLKDDRKKVLKFTKDEADAQALFNMFWKPDRDIVRVFKVARIGSATAWAVLAEKLTPLSASEKKHWNNLFYYMYNEWHIQPRGYGGMNREWLSDVQFKLQETGKYDEFQEQLEMLYVWTLELLKRNIDFWDIHAGNIMKRGRQDILSELGLAESPKRKIPVIRAS
jgi:hypothetical protein